MRNTYDVNALTRREQQILELVAVGWSNTEIAEHLVLAEHTVYNHIANVKAKLGVHTRARLIVHPQAEALRQVRRAA